MGVIGTVVTYCLRAAGLRAYVTTVPMKSTKVQTLGAYGMKSTKVQTLGAYCMKSTKVQTLGAYYMYCSSPVYYANARARKLATPRVVAVTRGAISSRSNTG